ncbi:hypothetical protein DVK01_19230 [Haloarcula sp. Atlit-120R]|nr:hypothetical protein DVK01_19230 [Haloarcula sp. Atlit-120R]
MSLSHDLSSAAIIGTPRFSKHAQHLIYLFLTIFWSCTDLFELLNSDMEARIAKCEIRTSASRFIVAGCSIGWSTAFSGHINGLCEMLVIGDVFSLYVVHLHHLHSCSVGSSVKHSGDLPHGLDSTRSWGNAL